jgi:hypothetical protein
MMISPLSVTLRDAVCPFAARRLGIDGVRGLRDGSFPRKSRNVTGSTLETRPPANLTQPPRLLAERLVCYY